MNSQQMNRMKYQLAILLMCWSLSVAAQTDTTAVASTPTAFELEAESPETIWDKANTEYINNNYDAAIAGYQSILERGLVSAKLYYNLANAHFKRNELGEAILYYHRALRLTPGEEDIRHNLSVAEARTKDTIDEIPTFFLTTWMQAVRSLMSSTAWSIISLIVLATMLVFTLLYLLGSQLALRKTGFYGMLLGLLLFVLTSSFAAAQRREQLGENRAVVMSTSAAVKSSPDRAATDLFVLHEGTVVEITNRLDGWCEVTIADGKKGWTEGGKIEVI